MQKQIKILMLVVALIMACTLTVNAADATASLNLSSAEVHKGDTFTVTLNVSCEEGINGLQGDFSYDADKLELVSLEVVDTTKWFNLGENLKLEVIHSSSDTETSADIVKATLKVKDTAEIGTKAKIAVTDLVLDSDATSNSTKQIGTKEIEVSIVEKTTEPGKNPGSNPSDNPNQNPVETPQEKTLTSIEITKAPTRTKYTAGEKFDKTGMKVVAKYSDGSSKEIKNYTVENGDKLVKGQTSVKISYTEGNVTKTAEQKITLTENATDSDNKNGDGKIDNTKTDKKMPNTGLTSIMGAIVVIGLAGIVCYIKYNKYKEI